MIGLFFFLQICYRSGAPLKTFGNISLNHQLLSLALLPYCVEIWCDICALLDHGGYGIEDFVGWCITDLVIKAQNDWREVRPP